jgi:hypothetical protein
MKPFIYQKMQPRWNLLPSFLLNEPGTDLECSCKILREKRKHEKVMEKVLFWNRFKSLFLRAPKSGFHPDLISAGELSTN